MDEVNEKAAMRMLLRALPMVRSTKASAPPSGEKALSTGPAYVTEMEKKARTAIRRCLRVFICIQVGFTERDIIKRIGCQ